MLITETALLFRLLLGHVIADFLLQSKSMVEGKKEKNWKSNALYVHSGVYAIVVFLAVSAWQQGFWLLPVLFVSHVLIDGWKASREDGTISFIFDQAAHLAVLTAVYMALAGSAANRFHDFMNGIWNSPRALVLILGYLLVLWPIGRLVNVMTHPFRRQLDNEKTRGLELAGLWIGCLERIFLLTFVLLDYLNGIPILLALKSIFRFGEIKESANRKETEYILIGTMLSFGFALAIGLAVKALLKTFPFG